MADSLGHQGSFQANLEKVLEKLISHVADTVLIQCQVQELPRKNCEASRAHPFNQPHHTPILWAFATSCEQPPPQQDPPQVWLFKYGNYSRARLNLMSGMARCREDEGHPGLKPPLGGCPWLLPW